MSVALLDANVLIALTFLDHVHHEVAESWFGQHESRFATCPVTQGALIRASLRQGASAAAALDALGAVAQHPHHEFWPDAVGYAEVSLRGVIGHRQVTDAYLAALARSNHGTLVTLDSGLAALHSDVAVLLPT